jgi:hypothetical protein
LLPAEYNVTRRRFVRIGAHLALCLVGVLLFSDTAWAQTPDPPTQASGLAFVSVFGTAFQKGDVSGRPRGLSGGATMASGAGVGARWSTDGSLDYWSIGFLQVMPAIRGAKTLQPTASVALGRATRGDDDATCLEVGGGVDLFLAGPIGLGIDLRYLHGLTDLGADTLRERYVSFALLWRF